MLPPAELALLVISLGAFLLILWNRLPIELVALLLMLILGLTGLVAPDQVLTGFSSSVVITLIGLFVITRGLEETGVVDGIATRLNRLGHGSEVRLIVVFMLAGALMSLIMNNVAAGAVLLPAAVGVARISSVRVSRLLIPLSFGTLVGGMATYLTTANIVMSTLLIDNGLEGLNMMSFIPTGGLIVLAGVAFMAVIGRRLLPDRASLIEASFPVDLQSMYHLEERTWELRIEADSRLVGVALGESQIGQELGLTVIAIWRSQHAIFAPAPEKRLRAGDYLLVLGRRERIEILLTWGTALRESTLSRIPAHEYHVNLTEVIIPPRSQAIGQTLAQLGFRRQFGVTAVAIWREGRSFRTDVGAMTLRVGDALLVVGYTDGIRTLARDRNYLVPTADENTEPARPYKAGVAIAITAVVLLLAILEFFPIPELMLAGAVAMALTGCLRMDEFFDAIEWKVIFLIAGMLPLSIALTESGLAGRIGAGIVTLLDQTGPLTVVMGMVIATVLLTQVLGGQVTALVIGPIAISTALELGISPQAMAVAISIACSTAFLTPIAHPVNLLMMGPGGYRFNDFFRVGLGMTLVTLATLMFGLVVFWGL
jgi:di/tricarboxylate transporter